MNKLATNIGLYHSRGKITDSELEAIYTSLVCETDAVYGKVHASVERFQREKRENAMRHSQKKGGLRVTLESFALEEALDPIWEPDVPKKKPVVNIPLRDNRFTRQIPANVPTEEQLNMFKHVEYVGVWGRTKPSPDWLSKEKKTAKPVINLSKPEIRAGIKGPATARPTLRPQRIVPAVPDLGLLFGSRSKRMGPAIVCSTPKPAAHKVAVPDESGAVRVKKGRRARKRVDSHQQRHTLPKPIRPGSYFAPG
jgi:hypothetical protein